MKIHAPRAACLFAAYGGLEGNVNHGGCTCLFEEISFWAYYSSVPVNVKLEVLAIDKGLSVTVLRIGRLLNLIILRAQNHVFYLLICIFIIQINLWVLRLKNSKYLIGKSLSYNFHIFEIQNYLFKTFKPG